MNCVPFNDFTFGPYQGQTVLTPCGVELYFTNKSADFKDDNFESEYHRFCKVFNADDLIILKQTHSAVIARLDPKNPALRFDADGVEVIKKERPKGKDLFFGIRTADCLPVYIETESRIILVHAGWRGVASGILERALAHCKDEKVTAFVVGPAASGQRYEVGLDVIGQIAEPVFERSLADPEKFFLDLKATALKVFEKSALIRTSDSIVGESSICTITDINWHSHRRDKEKRGSNLMFCRISF